MNKSMDKLIDKWHDERTLTTKEISYILSEARTECLKAHEGSSWDLYKRIVENSFKIIRRRMNLRGRAKRKQQNLLPTSTNSLD
jgi:hypothetical protein